MHQPRGRLRRGTGAPARLGGGGQAFCFMDPEGRVVRVIAGDRRHADAAGQPDRPEKITHVVLNTPRQEEAAAFWVNALGFRVSDRSLLTFIRCNDDHHSVAFPWGPGRHGPGNNVFAYFVGPEDFVIEYTAEIEQLDDASPVRTPAHWAYPPGHTDLWGATAPPSERMKAAQRKIAFASGLFHP